MTQDTTNEKPSRRGLFKWLGKVAAGASAAGFGLGVAAPLTAQAASTKTTRTKVGMLLDKAGNVLIPNCLICDGCSIISCVKSGFCGGNDPTTPAYVTYIQYQGCFAHGSCPSYQYSVCARTCSC